jgi:hypothetical protein
MTTTTSSSFSAPLAPRGEPDDVAAQRVAAWDRLLTEARQLPLDELVAAVRATISTAETSPNG